jgi:hypothetical protein
MISMRSTAKPLSKLCNFLKPTVCAAAAAAAVCAGFDAVAT